MIMSFQRARSYVVWPSVSSPRIHVLHRPNGYAKPRSMDAPRSWPAYYVQLSQLERCVPRLLIFIPSSQNHANAPLPQFRLEVMLFTIHATALIRYPLRSFVSFCPFRSTPCPTRYDLQLVLHSNATLLGGGCR
jgi:hypothetical protein